MNRVKHQKKIYAAAIIAAMTGSQAFSAIVGIDSFNQTNQFLEFAPPVGGPSIAANTTAFDESAAPEAIGQFRDMFIQTNDEINFSDRGAAAISSAQGQVQIANSVNSKINVAITWDGSDNSSGVNTSGLGGVDLLDGTNTGLLLDIQFADLGVDLSFNIWDTNGNVASVSKNFNSQVTGEQVFFSYADLVGDSVDLTSVGAIQLLASGPQAYDVDFSLLQSADPNPPTVSAPATIALVGLGMIGVSMTTRKRKS